MRVVAGRFRSRRLKSVPGLSVRPTPDRLRETLFNVLAPRIEGSVFADAYAGSGAVGIEAFSRGAARVILIERKPQAIAVIRENLVALGIANEITLVRGAASAVLSVYPCDIAFLDPPYDHPEEYESAFSALAKTACSLAIAQHDSKVMLKDVYDSLQKTRLLKQGDNSLSFYERRPA
jgi:16S rRNA (guanine(966)-N(2))-methyltransferase RsmD